MSAWRRLWLLLPAFAAVGAVALFSFTAWYLDATAYGSSVRWPVPFTPYVLYIGAQQALILSRLDLVLVPLVFPAFATLCFRLAGWHRSGESIWSARIAATAFIWLLAILTAAQCRSPDACLTDFSWSVSVPLVGFLLSLAVPSGSRR